ncbi:hypothetical protein P7K49_010075, partial [Saguinus oedipus]
SLMVTSQQRKQLDRRGEPGPSLLVSSLQVQTSASHLAWSLPRTGAPCRGQSLG